MRTLCPIALMPVVLGMSTLLQISAVSLTKQSVSKSSNCRLLSGSAVSFSRCARYSSTTSTGYRVASSYSAKGRKFDILRNVDDFPHPKAWNSAKAPGKAARPVSGQDAFFVGRLAGSGDVAFGVADGVGGWTESGVDPADFSHGLCQYMNHIASTTEDGKLKPQTLMQLGYEGIVNDSSIKAGGSTACVAIARGSGILEVANLGDSGFVQIRQNAVRYASEAQIHAFNTPYQLSIIPEKLLAQEARFGGRRLHDMPQDSHVSTHRVQSGDVLVFASDGVWDNLSPQDALKIVSKQMMSMEAWYLDDGTVKVADIQKLSLLTDPLPSAKLDSLQSLIASSIAGEAKQASLDINRNGPFAREVQKYYPGEGWHGGKPDDIVVVAVIVL